MLIDFPENHPEAQSLGPWPPDTKRQFFPAIDTEDRIQFEPGPRQTTLRLHKLLDKEIINQESRNFLAKEIPTDFNINTDRQENQFPNELLLRCRPTMPTAKPFYRFETT